LASGAGGKRKKKMKPATYFSDGAVERTRTSTGRPASTSS
jgi:hypothetical protein